ncbi:MAG: hypothetical protein NZ769_02580 [Anaerolineae bacterium]|nr:hypothetical protein [Anaerolineae bacterium]MCX8066922.1 hypothetical protein [Anaerolineae bacterium]
MPIGRSPQGASSDVVCRTWAVLRWQGGFSVPLRAALGRAGSSPPGLNHPN